jgi:hypothetical protein
MKSILPPCLLLAAVTLSLSSMAVAQAPLFSAATPCGQILTVQAGNTLTYNVEVSANTGLPGEGVFLNSTTLPGTATHTTPLPVFIQGPPATATTTFNWTTGPGDVGVHAVTYVSQNTLQQSTNCTIIIDVVLSTLPVFIPPTPCGQTLNASVGVPFSFTVSAIAPGVAIALLSGQLPNGATHTPPLPLQIVGPQYPVASSVFDWTPTQADSGLHTFEYAAFNQFGQQTNCSISVLVAECYLLLSTRGSLNMPIAGSNGNYLLTYPDFVYPVTMEEIPSFAIPAWAAGLEIFAQIAMYNPSVFPTDPIKMSDALRVTVGGPVVNYGPTNGGMSIWLANAPTVGSSTDIRFSIQW